MNSPFHVLEFISFQNSKSLILSNIQRKGIHTCSDTWMIEVFLCAFLFLQNAEGLHFKTQVNEGKCACVFIAWI